MPRDRDSKSDSERTSGKYSTGLIGRLDDAMIAKAILDHDDRRRNASRKSWWGRLVDWLKETYSGDSYG